MWVVLTYSPHSVVYIRWRWAVGGRERARAGACLIVCVHGRCGCCGESAYERATHSTRQSETITERDNGCDSPTPSHRLGELS